MDTKRFSVEEALKAFRLMLSWSVRFLVVGSGGGGTIERNYGLLSQQVSSGKINMARELRDALDAPTDLQFQTAFRAYSISNSQIARYVCRSFEAHLRGENEPATIFFENASTLNLEHVLPRASEGWDLPLDIAKGYHNRAGNLTLLDPRANVEVGNDLFAKKKLVYARSPFLLTSRLAEYETWGPTEIDVRQAELATYAPLVWPLTWKN